MTFWEWYYSQPFFIRWPVFALIVIVGLFAQASLFVVNLYRKWKGLPPVDELSLPKKGS